MLQKMYRIFTTLWEIYGSKSCKYPLTKVKIVYHYLIW